MLFEHWFYNSIKFNFDDVYFLYCGIIIWQELNAIQRLLIISYLFKDGDNCENCYSWCW